MTTPTAEWSTEVLEMCRREGFALAGVAPIAPGRREVEFRGWLSAGRHGEMAWLRETVEERLDPRRVLPGARSVVMVADLYAVRGQPVEQAEPGVGRIARYCQGRDYHEVLKRRVQRVCDEVRGRHPGAATRAFCDTAPVRERDLAAECGLGWVGKNTLLIHPGYGSWLVLGGFLTTLQLAGSADQRPVSDHCGTCTRCLDACPTGAITPYSVDATRCISYLTIEHESPIRAELAEKLGDWLVGCDVCQEVCPHNSARSAGSGGGGAVRPEYRSRRRGFDLLDLLGWDEPTRRARFSTSSMKRVTLQQVKRNALALLDGATLAALDEAGRRRMVRTAEDLAWDPRQPAAVRAQARRLAERHRGI